MNIAVVASYVFDEWGWEVAEPRPHFVHGGMNLYGYCGSGALGASDASGMWGLPAWIGGGVSCLFSGITDWIGASVGLGPSLCTWGTQCLASILAALITAGLDFNPADIALSGCVSAAINSGLSEIFGYLCDLFNCPYCPRESFLCRIAGGFAGFVAGRLGGLLGSSEAEKIGGELGSTVGNWISGSLGIGLAGPGAAAVDNNCMYGS